MIQLEHVIKKYGDFTAVEDLSLTVQDGEICVLLGPSGCGKSTTLRMINRLLEPSGGNIYINGKNIRDYQPEKLRQSIGYVVQSTGLFPHMTVMKNISVAPELLGWDKDKIAKRVDELLDLVGLERSIYRAKYPRALSGGEAQRVGVARALAADPPIILMDEPFGAVDPINRKNLQQAFLNIQKKLHKTIVFVTHDVEEAIYMGDKIAVLNNGRMEVYASPDYLLTYDDNSFVSSFLGQDYPLKMLGRVTLQTVLIPHKLCGGPTVAESRSLKNTLAFMIEHSVSEVNVADGTGNLLGMVDLTGIIMIQKKLGEKNA